MKGFQIYQNYLCALMFLIVMPLIWNYALSDLYNEQ